MNLLLALKSMLRLLKSFSAYACIIDGRTASTMLLHKALKALLICSATANAAFVTGPKNMFNSMVLPWNVLTLARLPQSVHPENDKISFNNLTFLHLLNLHSANLILPYRVQHRNTPKPVNVTPMLQNIRLSTAQKPMVRLTRSFSIQSNVEIMAYTFIFSCAKTAAE